jgi:hypothetical protein
VSKRCTAINQFGHGLFWIPFQNHIAMREPGGTDVRNAGKIIKKHKGKQQTRALIYDADPNARKRQHAGQIRVEGKRQLSKWHHSKKAHQYQQDRKQY